MLAQPPITLDILLPDGAEIGWLPYREADDSSIERAATRLLIPVPGSTWA
jgi:hypothetical protein